MTDAFDWNDRDNVIIDEQMTTAVYLNTKGHVVIRQAAEVVSDDPFVVIQKHHILDLILRLQLLLQEGD